MELNPSVAYHSPPPHWAHFQSLESSWRGKGSLDKCLQGGRGKGLAPLISEPPWLLKFAVSCFILPVFIIGLLLSHVVEPEYMV